MKNATPSALAVWRDNYGSVYVWSQSVADARLSRVSARIARHLDVSLEPGTLRVFFDPDLAAEYAERLRLEIG